jgi:hypothetical protein
LFPIYYTFDFTVINGIFKTEQQKIFLNRIYRIPTMRHSESRIDYCSIPVLYFEIIHYLNIRHTNFFLLISDFPVKTCGHPKIQNIMENITVKPGDKAVFNCKVGFSSIFFNKCYGQCCGSGSRIRDVFFRTPDPESLIPDPEGMFLVRFS